MKKISKLFISFFIALCTELSAFDNEIIISGEVLDQVAVDILELNSAKEGFYLHSNSAAGATVIVRNIMEGVRSQIYQNGVLSTLPLVYDLFDGPFVLGSSPMQESKPPVLVIDIKAH